LPHVPHSFNIKYGQIYITYKHVYGLYDSEMVWVNGRIIIYTVRRAGDSG